MNEPRGCTITKQAPSAERTTITSPGPRPPYHALTSTAGQNSMKMPFSSSGASATVSAQATAHTPTATT